MGIMDVLLRDVRRDFRLADAAEELADEDDEEVGARGDAPMLLFSANSIIFFLTLSERSLHSEDGIEGGRFDPLHGLENTLLPYLS